MRHRLLFGLVLVAMVVTALPAGAGQPVWEADTYDYGFFYGTFDETPNTALFAGGPIESFCVPPGEPGSIPSRVRVEGDGTVHIRALGGHQPIYLYETNENDIPTWLYAPGGLCEALANGAEPPDPFARGYAWVQVRKTIQPGGGPPTFDEFNSTTGWAHGSDGSRYRVRGTADLQIVNGELIGNPEDFVGFHLRQLGR